MKNLNENMKTEVSLSKYFAYISNRSVLLSREDEKLAFQLLEERENKYLKHLVSMPAISYPILTSYAKEFTNSEKEDKQLAAEPLNQIIKLFKKAKPSQASTLFVQEARSHSYIKDIQSDLYARVLESEFKNGSLKWRDKLSELRDPYIEAKNAIVVANLRLVVSFVHKIRAPSLTSDLIQEGNIGLMRAVEKFNWRNDVRFSTYASWWIKQSIRRYLADKMKTIRNPVYVSDAIYQLDKLEVKHYLQTGEKISQEELAEQHKVSKKKIAILQKAKHTTVTSLDTPIGEDENITLIDLVENKQAVWPDTETHEREQRELLDQLMTGLSTRERHILLSRYGMKERTLQNLGDEYNLSRERIRQLESQAIRHIRKKIKLDPKMLEFYSDYRSDG